MLELSRLEEIKLARKQFPLTNFLTLVYKAPHECYINYLEGAKLLHAWLTNDSETPLLDNYLPNLPAVHPMLANYYQHELATVLSGETYGTKHSRMYKAIVYFGIGYCL